MNAINVAQTIREQIGHGCLYMIGARNFVAEPDGLTFKIMRNTKRVTHIAVTLCGATDTYTVEAYNARSVVVATERGLYFDCLRDSIARLTGLAVSL